MRNMSFALTTEQFRNRTKTVTRRLGWKFLKKGDLIQGCVKCMGLKPGEKIERLGAIRVVSVYREELRDMAAYTSLETAREGFPEMSIQQFISMFIHEMKCDIYIHVTRIEFEYV